MRRGRLALLLLISGMLYARPNVVVAPLDPSIPAGVALVSQTNPSFEPLFNGLVVSELLRPLFQPILPYSIIVKNNSASPICAVDISVETVDEQGRHSSGVRFMEINPDGRFALPLGGSMFFSVDGTYTQAAWNLRSKASAPMPPGFYTQAQDVPAVYGSARSITFALDGVLFADGRFAGPDTGHSFEKYSDELAALLSLGKTILGFQGQGTGDLQAYLTALVWPSHSPVSGYDRQIQRFAGGLDGLLRQKGPDAVFRAAQSELKRAAGLPIHR